MSGEVISTNAQLELPGNAIADLLKPDLIYINEVRSVNGYENSGKFVCRVQSHLLTPALSAFCEEEHDLDTDPVYISHSAHPKRVYRLKGIIFPEGKPHDIWFWEDTTPISIIPFDKLVRKSVENFDKDGQDLILLEEMLELGIELLHKRRDRGIRNKVVEELSHVMVSSQVLKQVFEVTDEEIQAQAIKKLEKYGWDQLTV